MINCINCFLNRHESGDEFSFCDKCRFINRLEFHFKDEKYKAKEIEITIPLWVDPEDPEISVTTYWFSVEADSEKVGECYNITREQIIKERLEELDAIKRKGEGFQELELSEFK